MQTFDFHGFLPAKESAVYKHFLSIAQSRNIEYWKQTHNCNIAKQEAKNLAHIGFHWFFTDCVWHVKKCQIATDGTSS